MANLAANIKIGATVNQSVGQSFRQIEKRSNSLGKTVGKTSQAQTRQAGRAIQSGLQGQIFSTVAPALALGAPIAKAIEFESTLAEIGKVVNFQDDNGLAKMGQSILNMATDGRIPLAAKEIGNIVAAAGQAGIARHELLKFTEDAAKIGVAFDLSGAQAGSAMTGLRTIFSLNQGEAVLVADSFNHLSNNMDATARGILNVTNRVGGMGKMIGLSGQQVGALAATFIALKTPPEIAATGMKALFQSLATAPEQNGDFQDGLAELGFTAKGMKKSIERDAQGTIINFLKTVEGSKDQIGVLSKLFGKEYADDIAKLVGSLGTYEKSLGLIANKTKFAGSAQREYEVRAKTTENSLQLLRNQTNRVAINLGNTLLPAVNVVINALSKGIAMINTVIVKNEGLAKVAFTVVGAFLAYQGGIMGARLATMAFGQSMIGFSALVSPIGLVIAALAVGGILIQRNWGKIAAFFEGFSAGFKATVGPAFKPLIAVLLRAGTAFGQFFQPIVQSKEALDDARSAGERMGIMLGGLANRLATIPRIVGDLAARIGANPFFQSGVAIVTTIGAGIRAGAARLVAIFASVLARVRDYLPFSDARIGPLSRLTASGRAIITTIATGIRSVANRLLTPLRPIFARVAHVLGPVLTARLQAGFKLILPFLTPIRLAFRKLLPVFAKLGPIVKTLALGGFRTLAFIVRPLTALFSLLGGGLTVESREILGEINKIK